MGRSLRVMHLVPAAFDPMRGVIGGAERFASELARHMAVETPTTLVCFGARDASARVGKLHVRVLGRPWMVAGQKHNPFSWRIADLIRTHDLVHCHQRHLLATSAAALIARVLRRRVVVTDHGGGGWDISAYANTTRWFHAHLHVTAFSRNLARQQYDPAAHVIWGGVDTDMYSPRPDHPRERSVLFVGRLLPHKGVDILIRAVDADTPLHIVGAPDDARYLHDIRQLAAGRNVRFHLGCDDEHLVEMFRRAGCAVLPSVYHTMYGTYTAAPELLGLTLLEAMSCATPVVCTDVGGMPEVVQDQVCGFVVPPNEVHALAAKIRRLLDRPDEARRMGGEARNRVLSRFTWPMVVQRCLEVYDACAC